MELVDIIDGGGRRTMARGSRVRKGDDSLVRRDFVVVSG